MDTRTCKTPRISEENERQREQGWFLLRALQTAQMSFDLSHIPSSMVRPSTVSAVMWTRWAQKCSCACVLFIMSDCTKLLSTARTFAQPLLASVVFHAFTSLSKTLKYQVYDEHYKLAIYVTPSRCDDEVCNSARIRLPAAETLPCRQPLDMPTGFLDSSVPKNQTLNFTIFALEDVLLKVGNYKMPASYLLSDRMFNIFAIPNRISAAQRPSRSGRRLPFSSIARADGSPSYARAVHSVGSVFQKYHHSEEDRPQPGKDPDGNYSRKPYFEPVCVF